MINHIKVPRTFVANAMMIKVRYPYLRSDAP